MEVICIDDLFHPETRKIAPHLPKKGNLYTIRKVVWNEDVKQYGLLLSEIQNPKIKRVDQFGFPLRMEVNFHPKRFTTLTGGVLSAEMLDKVMNPATVTSEE